MYDCTRSVYHWHVEYSHKKAQVNFWRRWAPPFVCMERVLVRRLSWVRPRASVACFTFTDNCFFWGIPRRVCVCAVRCGVVGTLYVLSVALSATCIRLYARGQERRILPAHTTTTRYTSNTSLSPCQSLLLLLLSLSLFLHSASRCYYYCCRSLSLRSSHIPVSSTLLPPRAPDRARDLVHWSLLFMLHAVCVLAAFAGQFPEPHDSTRAHTVAHTLLRGSAS